MGGETDGTANPVNEAFEAVLGLPAWSVAKGHGSFLDLHFGEPILSIGEPRLAPLFIEGAPSRTLRRKATVHGQWHLWIYCCFWSVRLSGVQLAHCESDDITIARTMSLVNGQALTSVQVDPTHGRSSFNFDLGCVLDTWPAPDGTYEDEPVVQWMLFLPSGEVLSYRGDGMCSRKSGDTPMGVGPWELVENSVD